jgi:hypothetical protein
MTAKEEEEVEPKEIKPKEEVIPMVIIMWVF